MTAYLTPAEVLFIHARLISETGGSPGIRDVGLLQSALTRPQATFEGKELYSDIYEKAAALMQSLSQNHPFVDGNKRTAITSASLFLLRNGYRVETTNAEIEHFAIAVAAQRLSLDAIADWFRANSKSL